MKNKNSSPNKKQDSNHPVSENQSHKVLSRIIITQKGDLLITDLWQEIKQLLKGVSDVL